MERRKGPSWRAFLIMLGFNLSYVSVANGLVWLEPLAAGSGIPEIKSFLNGIDLPRVVSGRFGRKAMAGCSPQSVGPSAYASVQRREGESSGFSVFTNPARVPPSEACRLPLRMGFGCGGGRGRLLGLRPDVVYSVLHEAGIGILSALIVCACFSHLAWV